MEKPNEVQAAALRYWDAGYSIVPIPPNGKKQPAGEWKQYQRQRMDREKVEEFFHSNPHCGIGIVCGPVSQGFTALDLENEEVFQYVTKKIQKEKPALYARLPLARTPSGGGHIYFRSSTSLKREELAHTYPKGELLAEVRGEGTYIIVPPSPPEVHSVGNKKPYEMIQGDPADAPALDEEEVKYLLSVACSLKQWWVQLAIRVVPYWQESKRHDLALNLAGLLAKQGIPLEQAEALLDTIHLLTGDEESEDRMRALRDTYERHQRGEEVAGYTRLVEIVEEETVKEWEKYLSQPKEKVPIADRKTIADREPSADYAHAQTLSRLWLNKFKFDERRGKWREYAHGRWQPVSIEYVARQAAKDLKAEYYKQLGIALREEDQKQEERITKLLKDTNYHQRMKHALSFLQGWEGFYTDKWDSDPYLLNVLNGTLDLRTILNDPKDWRTKILRPHRPEDLLTIQAPVEFHPEDKGRAWLDHIQKVLPNPNICRQVQRDCGRALVGAVLEEKLSIWYGEGANGKTTTARVLMGVLGDYAIRAAPNLLVVTRHEEHPTKIADLVGRRLVFSVEIEDGKRLAEAVVKDLTGGDKKKARFMRQDYFEFEQTFDIILLTNHKPTIRGVDHAIWRRVRLIPWEVTIPKEEQKPQEEMVRRLLEEESSAILNWFLEGFADYVQDRHWIADEVQAATNTYRQEQDNTGDFLEDQCFFQEGAQISKRELYDAYFQWCEQNGEEPVKIEEFGKRLKARGIQEWRRKNKRFWVGVTLANKG